MTTSTTHTAQTLDRGLQILEVLAEHEHGLSVTEISKALDVHRTIAHRLIATLEARDYISRALSNRYQLGTGLVRLSGRVGGQLRSVAREILVALNKETDETVHLVAAAGTNVLFLDACESSKALRVTSRVGQALPAHATSVGKSILARLSEAELKALYPGKVLPKIAPQTIASRAELVKQLDVVRELGYAMSSEESEAGVGSIGVAIVDARGATRAALSIAAPVSRLTPAKVPGLVSAAQRAAVKIGSLL